MSYNFYLFLHLTSILVIFTSLGGIVTHILQGGSKSDLNCRKCLGMHHGIALLVAFVSGFGLIAKGGFSMADSMWIYVKIACWLFLGVSTALYYRRIIPSNMAWWSLLAVMFLAVYMAVFKPF